MRSWTGGFIAIGEVRARGATFQGQLVLTGADLTNHVGAALNLDGAQMERLSLARVAGVEGRVSLEGCQIGLLIFDEEQERPPPGALMADGWQVRALKGAMASNARLAQKWLDSLPAGERYSPQPARTLADVYDRAGHPDKARRLRYAAARRVASEAPWWAKPRHYTYGGLVGHGYYPLFTLWWLAVLFVFATVLATTQADLFTPAEPDKARVTAAAVAGSDQTQTDPLTGATACEELGDYPCFSPWSYALQTVVPPAAAVQTTAWQPSGWVLMPFTALKAAGWVLVALLLAGVTGILRRT